MAGILGRKLEMTRIIKNDRLIPITLVHIPSVQVVQVKTKEKEGYNAVVLGIVKKGENVAVLREGRSALSHSMFSVLREVALDDSEVGKYEVGQRLSVDVFSDQMEVTVTGFSKGKGFAGAMKRFHFAGGPATHGSKFHRALGSIGTRKPRRTHRGKKMHGHMGNERVTLKGRIVELVNTRVSVVGIRGSLPGARNSLLIFRF